MRRRRGGWPRVNYLVHRWVGIVLGAVMLIWFLSGVAMMYYPYPALAAGERLAVLESLRADSLPRLADVGEARRAVERLTGKSVARVRLARWNDRVTYAMYGGPAADGEGLALVDATNGALLSPVAASSATRAAAGAIGTAASPLAAELLTRGDHYYMGNERRWSFPVWRVRFADAERTAVYVAQRTGEPVAVVDRRARLTTWLGTVPHWLYVSWLYDGHFDAWLWLNILLPAAAAAIAVTGVILGVRQLFPRRHRGEWRVSGYHGVSRWHHVAGVVFGVLVLTWTLSGMLEVLGPSASPGGDVLSRAAGPAAGFELAVLTPGDAARRAAATGDDLLAVDLRRRAGRPGYEAHFRSGRRVWVDAVDGAVGSDVGASAAASTAVAVRGSDTGVVGVDHLTAFDAYYYVSHGRELPLPVWRVALGDAGATDVYVDPVTSLPVAVVDAHVRRWRWWREGLHDFDFPALVNRRPLWDVVVLPLMIGGVVSSITGVWLLVRRLRRLRDSLGAGAARAPRARG